MTSRWSIPWRKKALVAAVSGSYLLVGAGVALPISQALEASRIARHPEPERTLLEPGGLLLVEWLRLEGSHLLAAGDACVWLATAGVVLLLMPLGVLLSGLYDPEQKSALGHAQRALSLLGGLTLLFGATLLLRAVLLLLLTLVWGGLWSTLSSPAQGWLVLAAAMAAAVSWIVPGILQDLARAGLAGTGLALPAAVGRALTVFAQRPARVLTGYALPAAAALLTATLGLTLLGPARLVRLDSWGPWLGLLGHQLCLLALVAFRAVWFYHALELTNSSPQAPGGTRGGSGAPGGPNPDPAA